MLRRLLAALVALLVIAGILAACSGGSTPSGRGRLAISVTDPWARPSMGMDRAGAAYMVISNDGEAADALIGASSPAAAKAEIHETKMAADGSMGMSPVDEIPIPVGGSAELKPGGFHIMLIDLVEPLAAGDKIEITLTFREAGGVRVTAEVREN